jgi:hypothetical protein
MSHCTGSSGRSCTSFFKPSRSKGTTVESRYWRRDCEYDCCPGKGCCSTCSSCSLAFFCLDSSLCCCCCSLSLLWPPCEETTGSPRYSAQRNKPSKRKHFRRNILCNESHLLLLVLSALIGSLVWLSGVITLLGFRPIQSRTLRNLHDTFVKKPLPPSSYHNVLSYIHKKHAPAALHCSHCSAHSSLPPHHATHPPPFPPSI